ncbi:LOW QUALITY PROTEIN: Mesoderm induction early response protein 2, partial [Galemys pyrenaicus]
HGPSQSPGSAVPGAGFAQCLLVRYGTASSLERQSPGVASCLTHSLCPGEPGLQTTAGTPHPLPGRGPLRLRLALLPLVQQRPCAAARSVEGCRQPCQGPVPRHGSCPALLALTSYLAVSMGSAGHQFNLAELLSQNYGIREECEEAASGLEKPEEELEKHFIAQSSDMPLDELLALYGYEASDPVSDRESEGSESAVHLPDMTLDKRSWAEAGVKAWDRRPCPQARGGAEQTLASQMEQEASRHAPWPGAREQIAKDLLSGEEEEETQSSADDLTPSVTSHEASDLFPSQTCFLADGAKKPSSSASSDTEEDPLPANKCKKEIMVGPQFQADLSNLHLNRHCEKIYENEDQLLWDPNVLPEREVEEFLYRAVKRRWQEMAGQLPEGEMVKDSEQVGSGPGQQARRRGVGLVCLDQLVRGLLSWARGALTPTAQCCAHQVLPWACTFPLSPELLKFLPRGGLLSLLGWGWPQVSLPAWWCFCAAARAGAGWRGQRWQRSLSPQALYELVKCNFNVEEALRRLRFNVKVIRDGFCAWSEEECRNFEHGIRVHGKNFHLIQANKVRTRSVGECVEYYYLWKKSERYDYFSQQTRLGRRKYGLSGTTCVSPRWALGVGAASRSRPEPRVQPLAERGYEDTDQDLDGGDPEGPGCPRSSLALPPAADGLDPDQEPLARRHAGRLGRALPWAPSWLGLPGGTPHPLAITPVESPGLVGFPRGRGLCVSHALKWGLFFGPQPLSADGAAASLGEPREGSRGLPALEPGLCPFPQLDAPSAVPLPQRPPALAEPAFYPPATAALERSASPRMAVDFTLPGALPEELPLISNHVDVSGEPEEAEGPAQVALSVTEFGLIGIGDVNPFLATHPACPAPGLHSEPLSQ